LGNVCVWRIAEFVCFCCCCCCWFLNQGFKPHLEEGGVCCCGGFHPHLEEDKEEEEEERDWRKRERGLNSRGRELEPSQKTGGGIGMD